LDGLFLSIEIMLLTPSAARANAAKNKGKAGIFTNPNGRKIVLENV
jgi:hypothetical protein